MFKIKYHIYFLLFFLFGPQFILQAQDITTLKSEISGQNDTNKITTWLKIANLFSDKYGRPDSLLYYSEIAFKKASELNYTEGQQNALLNIAIAYLQKNNLDSSMAILNKLLIATKKSKDLTLKGNIKYYLGFNYRIKNDAKSAAEYYLASVSDYEKSKYYDGIGLAYLRLGGVFVFEKQFDQALLYGRKAITLLPKTVEPFTKVTILSGMSGICIQVATNDVNFIDTSIVFAKTALVLADQFGYYTKGNQSCVSISNAYSIKGDNELALVYCKQAMNYRKYLFPSEIVISYLNFSDCYARLKQYKIALAYLDSSKIVLRSSPDPFYEMLIEERVYNYNKETGNFLAALEGKERYDLIKDSLFTVEKNEAVNNLEQKYNRSENEKKINELNKENEISSLNVKFLAVGILAAILIIIVIVFFYRQTVLNNKFKTLEAQQRLNRARINPHFFFNALASIQVLSMDAENAAKVPVLISQFSKIMRQSLESTYDELTTVEEEIDFLTNYLSIQKIRFSDKFVYEITVDESIEINELKIPGMLLQPFIENSIEHGFKNISYKGMLNIIFKKVNQSLKITVADNGCGIDLNKEAKKYPSRAGQIIAERLLILNKQHKAKAYYELNAAGDGKGTIVDVFLPLIY